MSCYIIMPLLLGLAAISESFVRLVLTEKWISCVPFIQVFCFQYCFSIFGTVNLQSLKGIGKSDTILKLEFVKKPLFIIMIIITMHINPFAIAIGGLIYDIIGGGYYILISKVLKISCYNEIINILKSKKGK